MKRILKTCGFSYSLLLAIHGLWSWFNGDAITVDLIGIAVGVLVIALFWNPPNAPVKPAVSAPDAKSASN